MGMQVGYKALLWDSRTFSVSPTPRLPGIARKRTNTDLESRPVSLQEGLETGVLRLLPSWDNTESVL